MAQPVVMRDFLSDRMAGGLGFLPRCLICEPPSTIGTRLHAKAKGDAAAVARFAGRLKQTLARPMPTGQDGQTLTPRVLDLVPEARAQLVRFADTIEVAQAPGGDLAQVTAYASKAAEQAARIEAVLALWRDLDTPAVSERDMADGIALAEFYLSEAVRLADAAPISQKIDRAEALRCWLLHNWPHAQVTQRDIQQCGPNALREASKATEAIRVLEDHNWLTMLPPGTVVDGKTPKTA